MMSKQCLVSREEETQTFEQCVIARHQEGISLNNYEFILAAPNEIQIFENKTAAIQFLKNHGCTDEDIYYSRFFSYNNFQSGFYFDVD